MSRRTKMKVRTPAPDPDGLRERIEALPRNYDGFDVPYVRLSEVVAAIAAPAQAPDGSAQ
jgi:hypothetical protein